MSSRVVEEKAWICWDAFSGRASWASWRDRVDMRGRRREPPQGIALPFSTLTCTKRRCQACSTVLACSSLQLMSCVW